MPTFEQGDVVRVPFPYTDRPIRQKRPALVISTGPVGEDGRLLWVAMITSAENRSWQNGVPFAENYRQAGLPAPSVVRPCKIATIQTTDADKLGSVAPAFRDLVMDVIARLVGRL